jgi:hypothetical protein
MMMVPAIGSTQDYEILTTFAVDMPGTDTVGDIAYSRTSDTLSIIPYKGYHITHSYYPYYITYSIDGIQMSKTTADWPYCWPVGITVNQTNNLIFLIHPEYFVDWEIPPTEWYCLDIVKSLRYLYTSLYSYYNYFSGTYGIAVYGENNNKIYVSGYSQDCQLCPLWSGIHLFNNGIYMFSEVLVSAGIPISLTWNEERNYLVGLSYTQPKTIQLINVEYDTVMKSIDISPDIPEARGISHYYDDQYWITDTEHVYLIEIDERTGAASPWQIYY